MCSIIDKYIAQIFPDGAYYSDTYAKEAVVVGGNLVLDVDHGKSPDNAKGIIIHSVIIQFSTGAGTYKLVDIQNNIIMSFQASIPVVNDFKIHHYLNSGRLRLTLQGAAGKNMHMTVLYQFLNKAKVIAK